VSWIRKVAAEDAPGPLKNLYERIRATSSRGQVSELWQSCGLDPGGLDALHAHYRALMAEPAPLSAAQAELIALVVSATNGCGYCVAHHGPRLARALGDEPPARDRVLLDAAVALTCEPAERKQEDIERLREYGFDDAAILRATEIAAYYNLINRLVSALGVELEPGLEAWEFGTQT
jgi:AhpD family alkylhydroperoxidase